MRVWRQSTNEILDLTDQQRLGSGGEARIYMLPGNASLAAKIWHKPTLERARKLGVMLANPPSDPMAAQGHASIAWPVDLLCSADRQRTVAGFVMPRVTRMQPIIDFFHPRTRLQKCPLFNYFYLTRTARNLATAIRALHERGYVIGDLNESNILVSDTALVTLVDTDSFQVWDARQGAMYRCRVGKPEFTPPEIQGQTFASVDRDPKHDLFGLGVLLFQLLMEGTHPFAGLYQKPGDPPPYEKRIAEGHWPHENDPRVPYEPSPAAPPFGMLNPVLQHLFIRCFREGFLDPALRPDTTSWQYGLEEAEKALVFCWNNDQHIYSGHLTQCPWCERKARLGGRDPFPGTEAVREGRHLPKPPPVRTQPARNAGGQGPVSAGLPNPPVPRPIPRSAGQLPSAGAHTPTSVARRIHQAFGGGMRNDYANGGCFLSVVSLVCVWLLPVPYNGLSLLLSMLAILMGLAGEIHAHSWLHDGRGRWPARAAMGIGTLAILVFIR